MSNRNQRQPKEAPKFKQVSEALEATIYARSKWDPVKMLAMGIPANTPKNPLPDAKALVNKPAGLYFVKGTYASNPLQLAIRYEKGGFSFASIARDKNGEYIKSEDNAYQLVEVKANARIEIPNTDDFIERGKVMIKAYAIEAAELEEAEA